MSPPEDPASTAGTPREVAAVDAGSEECVNNRLPVFSNNAPHAQQMTGSTASTADLQDDSKIAKCKMLDLGLGNLVADRDWLKPPEGSKGLPLRALAW